MKRRGHPAKETEKEGNQEARRKSMRVSHYGIQVKEVFARGEGDRLQQTLLMAQLR